MRLRATVVFFFILSLAPLVPCQLINYQYDTIIFCFFFSRFTCLLNNCDTATKKIYVSFQNPSCLSASRSAPVNYATAQTYYGTKHAKCTQLPECAAKANFLFSFFFAMAYYKAAALIFCCIYHF